MRKFLTAIIEKFTASKNISFSEAVGLLKNTQGEKFLTGKLGNPDNGKHRTDTPQA
jgi:hypothetical protein